MTSSDPLNPLPVESRNPFAAIPLALRLQLVAFFVIRTIINTGYRMVYPFLPFIAAGLGVAESSVTNAIALRSGLGLFSPLMGTIADRWGRRAAMMVGVSCFTVAMLLIFIWPTFPMLVFSLILADAGKIIFDPSMYAFLGDRVPYRQRGLAVAITELGWSGPFVIGMPLVGWLIARGGWTAPFPALTILGLLALVVIWRIIPNDPPPPSDQPRPSLLRGIRVILTNRVALAGLSIGVFISMANELVSIVYGSWMNQSFALQAAALGAASTVIGIAELSGEGLVAALVDRLGKKRAVAIGMVVSIITCILLPVIGQKLEGALIGLFLFYITFEFTLVASLPLMTELAPNARATIMAVNISGISLGRTLGSLIGPVLFVSGLQVNALAAALINGVALAVLLFFVSEHHGS